MPFTPYHFGPGLLTKSFASKYFSFGAFAATQVVIDCETLYYILQNEYPIHRVLHTFLGATLVGIALAIVILGLKQFGKSVSSKFSDSLNMRWPSLRSESSVIGIFLGGIIGGVTHPLLDGLMHRDVQPFAPWSSANPFLDKIGVAPLHTGCLVAGIIGFVLMGIWLYRENNKGS